MANTAAPTIVDVHEQWLDTDLDLIVGDLTQAIELLRSAEALIRNHEARLPEELIYNALSVVVAEAEITLDEIEVIVAERELTVHDDHIVID